MHLDFAQVVTQIFAFLIVFYVMRKYGWAPLLAVLDERKESIRAQYEEIERQKADLVAMQHDYKQKLATIDAEGRAKIQEIVKEGRKIAQDIQDAAKHEAKLILQKTKDEADREVREAKNRLKNEMVLVAVKAAEKILEESIDAKKHEALLTDFVKNVEFT